MSERWNPEGYAKTNIFEVLNMLNDPWFKSILNNIILEKHDRVLEVGVGGGKFSALFAMFGCDVTMVDNNPAMLYTAQDNFPYFRFRTRLDDARTLVSIEDNHYDIVFSDGLVEHFLDVNERKNVVRNLYDKVAPEGVLIYSVPLKSSKDDEHQYETADEVMIEANGFLNTKNIACIKLESLKENHPVWVMVFVQKDFRKFKAQIFERMENETQPS